ncbi:MAG TPA: ABC transporter permease [Vicinamibacterales bacterium]|nr:ABC transporter permease [Vicinamibacterales bacterium]
MSSLREWIRRLWGTLRPKRDDSDLEEELWLHLELAAEEAVRAGHAPEQARQAARIRVGGVAQAIESLRDQRGLPWLDHLARDVRYALRQIRRNPAFSSIAIATLALGIGVNTAMFSAVDAVLIRPLPFADADRLVMIWDDDRGRTGSRKFFSTPPEWDEWRRHNTVFTDIAASQPGDAALSNNGAPEELPARKVTANFWSVLGAEPLLGRVFTEEEDARGARVVVISHGLWQRRFGASPDVVNRTITLNDNPYQVIGVLPREFYFMPARDIDVWMPAAFSAAMLRNWGWHDVHCVARLKPGVTLRQASESMAALSLQVTAPHFNRPRAAVVVPLREELAGKTGSSLIMLLCASAAVLLIACVNLANLLMSRAAVRHREVAVRAALGAGRGRLIAQFLIESLVLAGLGAVAGLALAIPVMRFLETLVPQTMAAVRLTLDWRVLAFSAGIATAAGLTFGLTPALGGSRRALQQGLHDGGRGSAGARSHWFQHALIVTETALAVVLLTSGALLLQTFQHLRQLDLGIRSERLLTFVTPLFRYRDFDRRVAFVNAELEHVRAIPGVVNAGAISRVPLTVNDQATFYILAGQTGAQAREQVALSRVVTRDYFATVGARLHEGRFFDASDQRSESPVAIVNESFADRNFPERSPIGARFQFGRWGSKNYWYTIVGVVKEIRDRGVAEELQPTVYRVHEQADQTGDQPSGIVVRTAVEPTSIVAAVRAAIWSIDKNQPVARVQTLDDIVARQLAVPSQNTALSSAFALLALLLASLGLYGVLSYAVTQRTNEIGVRMALGATSKDILLSFSKRGLALTLAGLAIGVVLAAVAARLMATLFYGFRPTYIPAVAVVSIILLSVAALACFVPARRASRVNPLIALQHE